MGTSQTKPFLVDSNCVTKSGMSSSRGFSTLGIGIVSHIPQKMSNIFTNRLPTMAQMNTLERNKQLLSSPDIFVDININTPIFEAAHGKAMLTVPDEGTSAKTKSISDDINWCPIYEKVGETSSSDCQKYKICKKEVRVVCNQTFSSIRKDSSIRAGWTINRSLDVCTKPKDCYENCKVNSGYNMLNDRMEDFQLIFEDNRFDADTENNKPTQRLEHESSIPFLPKNMDSSDKPFPAIRIPIVDNDNCEDSDDRRKSWSSESESESGFVIFSENVQITTPSASSLMRRDLCTTINNFFTSPALERQQRQRQFSECSDDSIVFCYESDQDENFCQNVTDFDSDDGSEVETDENDCENESKGTESRQPDSGFVERKVQFNLKPEVHVMRTWDFAYRQARKGDWEMAARDRERFRKRIHKTEEVLSIVFDKHVRDRVYQERFK